jgi:hypothetical protein
LSDQEAIQHSRDLREQIAAYAHTAWSAYMDYFLAKCITQPDGALLIPAGYVQAIERLIATPYADLSLAEKQGDLDEADKLLILVNAALVPPTNPSTYAVEGAVS